METEKEKLLKKLKQIQEIEKKEKEDKERQELIHKGFYSPLKKGVIIKSCWFLTEYSFEEIDDGWYGVNDILGKPDFKKGTEVVLINCQGELKWFPVQDDNDYFYIEDNECGLEENSPFVNELG